MLWMQTYLFYCSVRLGVIVIAFLTLLQLLVPAVLLIVFGIELIDPVVDLFKNDDYYRRNVIVVKVLNIIEQHPQDFIVLINVYLFTHIATCILAAYGAFKLMKYLLLPCIILELVRVIFLLACHIVLMIVLKKLINLGVLVAFTLLGGFLILYLAYNWSALVALFQIINLIRCDRYRALYGDDPYSPHIPTVTDHNGNQFTYNTIQNVHVITTPTSSDIDELKQKNHDATKMRLPPLQKKQIVSVLPANYQSGQLPPTITNAKRDKQRRRNWWRSSKNQTQLEQQPPVAIEQDTSVNYGNWQWSELLAPAVSKRKMLIGSNWY